MFVHILKNKFLQKIRWRASFFDYLRLILFVLVVGGIFLGISSILAYKMFKEIVIIDADVGPALVFRMISVLLLLMIPISTLSISLMSLNFFYQSPDLPLLFLSPINKSWVYLDRKLDIFMRGFLISGSFLFSIFLALAFSLEQSPVFMVLAFFLILPFIAILLSLGNLISLISSTLFTFQRSQRFYTLLATIFFGLLGVVFRFFRPEKLINPDERLKISEFIQSIKIPLSEWLPSDWVAQGLQNFYFENFYSMGFYILCLYLLAAIFLTFELFLANKFYFSSWIKFQEEREIVQDESGFLDFDFFHQRLATFDQLTSTILRKDLILLKRDPSQWSQGIIFFFMIIIYLYSVTCIPESPGGASKYEVFFFNLGFGLFIVSALAARFIYTAIGAESENFQLFRASGISVFALFRAKILFYLPGVLFFSCILIIGLNSLIVVPTELQLLSLLDMLVLCTGIVFMAGGIGAIFADFASKTIEEKAFGFGNLIFIIASIFYIGFTIIFQLATYSFFIHNHYPDAKPYLLIISFLPTILVISIPILLGARTLSNSEW
ncbi:hypothetical protein ACFL35_13800 [Candidatus Riflebacteria bacterium]